MVYPISPESVMLISPIVPSITIFFSHFSTLGVPSELYTKPRSVISASPSEVTAVDMSNVEGVGLPAVTSAIVALVELPVFMIT